MRTMSDMDADPAGARRAAMRSWRAAPAEDARGGAAYDRARCLPRLIAFDPDELRREGPALDAAIRARLERALRTERRRGASGRSPYDPNRHLALVQALAAERRRGDRKT